MRISLNATASVLAVLIAGCTETAPDVTAVPGAEPIAVTTDAGDGSDGQSSQAGDSAKPISLEIVSWTDLQEWVALQKGKVVVVDVWSTSCPPCMEEFPHFVELHSRLGDRVACASMSIDFYGAGETPQEIRPRVLEFLETHKATTANFVSSTADEEILDAIDVAAIPAVLVYDQSGELKKTFANDNAEYGANGFGYEKDINPFVEQLLKSAE